MQSPLNNSNFPSNSTYKTTEIFRVDLFPRESRFDSRGRLASEILATALPQLDTVGAVATAKSYFIAVESLAKNDETSRQKNLITLHKMMQEVVLDPVCQHLMVRPTEKADSFAVRYDSKKNIDNARKTDLNGVEDSIALYEQFAFAAQVAFKRGVTDNEGASLFEGIADYQTYKNNTNMVVSKVCSAQVFLFSERFCTQLGSQRETLAQDSGEVQLKLDRLAKELFANALVEDVQVLPLAKTSMDPNSKTTHMSKTFTCPSLMRLPKQDMFASQNPANKACETVALSGLSLEAQRQLANQRHLYFSTAELQAIALHYASEKTKEQRRSYGLNTDPTDVELEVLAQTWSEHCKHKIFSATVLYREQDRDGKNIGKEVKIDSLFHTTIKALTDALKASRLDLLSVFSDNAGVVRFDEKHAYACKVETHNAPSMLDPFGGAITGIVGVNRDIIGAGRGFKPIFNLNVLCFADPNKKVKLPPRIFSAKRLLTGVHAGIREGGNQSGIPTINGAMWFHPSYLARPLVFCGTVGFAPLLVGGDKKKQSSLSAQNASVGDVDETGKAVEQKEILPKDKIVMVGGLVGRDGIHGATSSSQAMSEAIPSSMVQIADPITQKKALDFLLQARDQNLFRAITDNGAGGLSSSVGEMALLCGGADIDMACVPLKEEGLAAWEIFVSESQERMTLAVPPENSKKIIALAKEFDCQIAIVGEFNDSGQLVVRMEKEVVAALPLAFLHDGLPTMQLEAVWQTPLVRWQNWVKATENASHGDGADKTQRWWQLSKLESTTTPLPALPVEVLHLLLASPTIASKEDYVRQYDHEVQARTVLKPFDGVDKDAPMDAGVVRPLFGSRRALAAACGGSPRYAAIDASAMAACAVDEAVRNLLCVGVNLKTIVGLDNFCWPDPLPSENREAPNPMAKHNMAQLVRACWALQRVCSHYEIPLVSGKDSMKNDYRHKDLHLAIVPTMLFTAIGIVENCEKITTSASKREGSAIYLLGDSYGEMGESEHHYVVYGQQRYQTKGEQYRSKNGRLDSAFYGSPYYKLPQKWAHPDFTVPLVREQANKRNYKALQQANVEGLVLAAHDLSEGGLAVSATEMCFGNGLGMQLELSAIALLAAENDDFDRGIDESSIKLFSESNGRILIEVLPEKEKQFIDTMQQADCQAFARVGQTTASGKLEVYENKKLILKETIDALRVSWKKPLKLK